MIVFTVNSIKMISDDLTTPLSAIVALFMARRRFGRTYYDAIRSFCWWAGVQLSVEEVVKTRIKAGKKRGRGKNTHTERRTRTLSDEEVKREQNVCGRYGSLRLCVAIGHMKRMHFSKEKKK